MKKYIFILFLISTWLSGLGQSPYISRYLGGDYLSDPVYQLEIFNPSTKKVSLEGYILVSRQYVVRLPSHAQIPAKKSLKMGKKGGPGRAVDLLFDQVGDFIIRIPEGDDEGDYVMLLDPKLKIVDAFYFDPNPRVSFLPDEGELITFDNKRIPFRAPAVGNPAWSYLQISPDPALAFVRINGLWRGISRSRNTLPATKFGKLEARYVDGIVTVNIKSLFERDCLDHSLERSEDGRIFVKLKSIKAVKNADKSTEYRFYDDKIEKNKRYYYRMRNVDRFGFEVKSSLVELRTDEIKGDFSMEVFVSGQGDARRINVRFSTRDALPLRLKILDEQFRELDVIFYKKLQANGRYLVKFDTSPKLGKYFIVADTEKRRYYTDIFLE